MVVPHQGMVIPRSVGSIQRLASAKGAREDSGWGSWVSINGGFTGLCYFWKEKSKTEGVRWSMATFRVGH